MTNEILTASEAAKLLGVHVVTLRKMCSIGQIPHKRLGSAYRFSRQALIDWLSESPGEARNDGVQTKKKLALQKAS